MIFSSLYASYKMKGPVMVIIQTYSITGRQYSINYAYCPTRARMIFPSMLREMFPFLPMECGFLKGLLSEAIEGYSMLDVMTISMKHLLVPKGRVYSVTNGTK